MQSPPGAKAQVWVLESGTNSRGFTLETRERELLLLTVSLQSCPMTKAGPCGAAGSCGMVEGGAAATLRRVKVSLSSVSQLMCKF